MNSSIIEINEPASNLAHAVEGMIKELFPECALINLNSRIINLRNKNILKIFAAEVDKEIAAFIQILYLNWDDYTICDIDLLGTSKKYRRSGLAQKLFSHCIYDIKNLSVKMKCKAGGILTLIDLKYDPIAEFHLKNKGQIRRDALHESGDAVVWYPLTDTLNDIKTEELLKLVNNFGKIIALF